MDDASLPEGNKAAKPHDYDCISKLGEFPKMVDIIGQFESGSTSIPTFSQCDNKCQSERVGGSLSRLNGSGEVESERTASQHNSPKTENDKVITLLLCT